MKHISHSQIDLFAKCPEAWRRRYIERDRRPPGFRLHRGIGFHAAAEENTRQKIDTHVDLPRNDLVEIAVEAYRGNVVSDGVTMSAEERSIGYRGVFGQTADQLARLSGVHADEQAPHYQPIAIEQEFRIQLPSGHHLVGRLDLVAQPADVPETPMQILADFKSSARKKGQDEADASTQLTIYEAGHRLLYDKPADQIIMDVAVATKTKQYRQSILTMRGEGHMVALAHRIDSIITAIDSGNFPPASPGAWWCSAGWCDYWNDCKYVPAEVRRGERPKSP